MRSGSADTEVLIVGAGPTGLVLALILARLGVRVRTIDKTAEPGTNSRAIAVHARTLEFYRQLGIAQRVVDAGLEFIAANLWVRGRRRGRAVFGEIGTGMSPYPYVIAFPQDAHERLLISELATLGVQVERRTELVSFTQRDTVIEATIRDAQGGTETIEVPFIAGCDGAHSVVRTVLHTGFPGGTYDHVFYVADVDAGGAVANDELHVILDTADFLAVFPLGGKERMRLIGTVRDELAQSSRLGWEDVSHAVIDHIGIDIHRVNWFSTYHVHHRVASRFTVGRAFLLGDAAHIHSPVGGQGMNTGIGDAVNLAWKLAAVLRGANPKLLETYEPERVAFAKQLVRTTDEAFVFVTRNGPLARFVRMHLVPLMVPMIFRVRRFRRFMFRTVSQIGIEYRDSALSHGDAGAVHAGDRLPWVPDNFAPLASLAWQLHVYGTATAAIERVARESGIALHVFPYTETARRAGLVEHAVYVVRPDGYVGFAAEAGRTEGLTRYLGDWVTPTADPSSPRSSG